MSKTLIVVESPAKARTIQKYLGDDYIVRPSGGHIMDLISNRNNRLGIKLEDNYKPVYAPLPEKRDTIRAIVDASGLVDAVYLASDPDREGEAIAWHLASLIKTKHDKVPVKRVLFYQITKQGIKDGISKPLELDENKYAAQQARRVLDRLVGYLVSPFVIDLLGPHLSAGRVQSVAVRMIADRETEIETFIPEEYWSISANLAKSTDKFLARYADKVTSKDKAAQIKKDLEKDTYQVTDVVAETKPKYPFPPFTTSTLQQSASRFLGMSSTRAMKAAQTLYESGIVTYIRTDSVRSSPESLTEVRSWLQMKGHKIPEKPVLYTAKANSQDAHEAIRPTDLNTLPDHILIGQDEKKLYKLIWERFIASQMKPALYDTVSVTIQTSSNHTLKAHGRTLKEKGWLEITGDLEKDEEESKLPILKVKDLLSLVEPGVKAEKKATQPPPRYKEHSLIKELEKRGIGRPATYAPIIKKVTDRGYVEKEKDIFKPTELGKKVVDLLVKFFDFMQYQYTANMEEELDKIENGTQNYLAMMQEFFPNLKEQIKKAYKSYEKYSGVKCVKCGSDTFLRFGIFGYYLACIDNEVCKTKKSCKLVDGKPVTVNVEDIPFVPNVFCPECNGGMVLKDGRFGKFYSCAIYPSCRGNRKVPSGYKCDKCGFDMYVTIFDGIRKLACMGYPHCKNVKDHPDTSEVSDWVDPKEIKMKMQHKVSKKLLGKKKTPAPKAKKMKVI